MPTQQQTIKKTESTAIPPQSSSITTATPIGTPRNAHCADCLHLRRQPSRSEQDRNQHHEQHQQHAWLLPYQPQDALDNVAGVGLRTTTCSSSGTQCPVKGIIYGRRALPGDAERDLLKMASKGMNVVVHFYASGIQLTVFVRDTTDAIMDPYNNDARSDLMACVSMRRTETASGSNPFAPSTVNTANSNRTPARFAADANTGSHSTRLRSELGLAPHRHASYRVGLGIEPNHVQLCDARRAEKHRQHLLFEY